MLADLRDIDAIVTDPLYELEYVHLLHDLAALADPIFKPDGIMAVSTARPLGFPATTL